MKACYIALACVTGMTLLLIAQAGTSDSVHTPHQAVMYHAPVPPPVQTQAPIIELVDETPAIYIPTPEPTPTVTFIPLRVISTPTPAPEPTVVASRYVDKDERVTYCESNGIVNLNTGNGYYGKWQFDLTAWRAMGGTGLPSDASEQEQDYRAHLLMQHNIENGLSPYASWPVCGLR